MSKHVIVESDSIDDSKTLIDVYNVDLEIGVMNTKGVKCISLTFDNNTLRALAEKALDHLIDMEVDEVHRKFTKNKEDSYKTRIFAGS